VILAEDDSSVRFSPTPVVVQEDSCQFVESRRSLDQERELILGWTPKAACIVKEYGDYVLPGSAIDIMVDHPSQATRQDVSALNQAIDSLETSLIDRDPLDKENLVSIDPARYNNIIILGQNGGSAEAEQSDAETLMILLLLRSIFQERGKRTTTKLIAEVLESRNRDLVSRAGVDNFVVSNQLISMIMAQISENKEIKEVYQHLFKEDGFEIYIKPASLYLDTFPQHLSFADLMSLAQKRNEICLGVKLFDLEHDINKNFGIRLNPPKDQVYTIIDYDELVVLAENET
jgi:hypothetical protein